MAKKANSKDETWEMVFEQYKLLDHDFTKLPFHFDAGIFSTLGVGNKKSGDGEARILCKHDSRAARPKIFRDNNLFILPTKNGKYALIQGEGYIDIEEILDDPIEYNSTLDFELLSSKIGDSEMQHLDFAYATSLIRSHFDDPSLMLTIRGRKYTPELSFEVCGHKLDTASVQTEVDAGYEGRDQIVLIEAKNSKTKDTIIRQLYYPYRQWLQHTNKKIKTVFFEKQKNTGYYCIWNFAFSDPNNYNSIYLENKARYKIIE